MATTEQLTRPDIRHPINFTGRDFITRKFEYYQWLREEEPVYKGKISVIRAYFLARYDDCVGMLKDPRFVRNRTTATGGGRMPFPMPKSLRLC